MIYVRFTYGLDNLDDGGFAAHLHRDPIKITYELHTWHMRVAHLRFERRGLR